MMWSGNSVRSRTVGSRKIPLRDRVTLYYALENRQVTDTYLTNRGDPKRRRAMAQAVKEFCRPWPCPCRLIARLPISRQVPPTQPHRGVAVERTIPGQKASILPLFPLHRTPESTVSVHCECIINVAPQSFVGHVMVLSYLVDDESPLRGRSNQRSDLSARGQCVPSQGQAIRLGDRGRHQSWHPCPGIQPVIPILGGCLQRWTRRIGVLARRHQRMWS